MENQMMRSGEMQEEATMVISGEMQEEATMVISGEMQEEATMVISGEMQEEATMEVVEKMMVETHISEKKNNIIQVSSNKRPLHFYVSLAKKYLQNHKEIELSALGMAIGTVVTVSEILKNSGLATEKKVQVSTIGTADEAKGRMIRKAKIEITLEKLESFDKGVSPRNKDENKQSVDPEI